MAEGDVPTLVRAARVKAKENGKILVVYVGADWCPPCKRFHQAVMAGEMDKKLADYTFLTLDATKDEARILAGGYGSKFIPFFVLPGADGRKKKAFEVSTLKLDQAMGEILSGLEKFRE
jgi:thiol:disulfide interchange protein